MPYPTNNPEQSQPGQEKARDTLELEILPVTEDTQDSALSPTQDAPATARTSQDTEQLPLKIRFKAMFICLTPILTILALIALGIAIIYISGAIASAKVTIIDCLLISGLLVSPVITIIFIQKVYEKDADNDFIKSTSKYTTSFTGYVILILCTLFLVFTISFSIFFPTAMSEAFRPSEFPNKDNDIIEYLSLAISAISMILGIITALGATVMYIIGAIMAAQGREFRYLKRPEKPGKKHTL